jgi:dTMP kinase
MLVNGSLKAKMSGFFITFEGIDGVGKTTQINMLVKYIEQNLGRKCTVTHEPGGTSVGVKIRNLVQHDENIDARTEALLYASDRAEHVDRIIRPALNAGNIVLCDRFVDSSLAYQSAGRELNMKDVAEINKFAVAGIMPSLTFLLDIEADIALGRLSKKKDRLEQAGLEFFERARFAYLELAKMEPDRFVIIDALESVEHIHNQLRKIVKERLSAV